MSGRLGGPETTYGEIGRYIEKLKQEKRVTDQNIANLERERDDLDRQMATLERKRNEVNNRIRTETEISAKQERSIQQADGAYQKIIDSSRTLADFVRNEYQVARRE